MQGPMEDLQDEMDDRIRKAAGIKGSDALDAIALAWERMPAPLKAELVTGELPVLFDVEQDGVIFAIETNSDGRWRVIANGERVVAHGQSGETKSPSFYDGGKE